MFNLVEQFLLQEIGEDTPNRSIPADAKSALTIMCTTRMSGEHSSDDFIRLSNALRSDTVSFQTLLESVRRHCQSSSYHFQFELHQWMPQQDQHSVLHHLTSYLNLMEKAMSSPFILLNVMTQFKQFLHKHPQTRPHVFTLATGIDKAVESKVDFPSFRAAVSAYMQDFLVFTVDPPRHLGTLYSSQLREEEPAAPKIKIITKQQPQQSYNPKQPRQHQQHVRFQIVNDPSTYTSSTPSPMSSSSSQIIPVEEHPPQLQLQILSHGQGMQIRHSSKS
jgi:hypothetical protein